MAMTTTALWNESRLNMRVRRSLVVSLTDGTNVWLIGTQEMILTDGHVFQGILSMSEIKTGFDIYSKRWTTPSVTVTMSNIEFTRTDDSDSFCRLSDLLTGLVGETASVYLFIGDRMSALADGLLRYSGTVIVDPEYDHKEIRVQIVADLSAADMTLPNNYIGDIYGNAPKEFYDLKIPIAYGRYIGESDTESATGLMLCVQVSLGDEPKFVAADHVCDDLTAAYLKIDGLPDVSVFENCVITENDSGRGTVQPDRSGSPGYFYLTTKLRPVDNYKGDYVVTLADTDVNDFPKAIDRDSNSYAEILDVTDTGASGNMTGRANFCWDDYSPENADGGRVVFDDWTIEILAQFVNSGAYFGGVYGSTSVRLYYSEASGVDSYLALGSFTTSTSKALHQFVIDKDTDPPDMFFRWIEWKMRTRDSENAVPAYSENDIWPFHIRIALVTDQAVTNPAPNGVTHDQWLCRVFDIRCKLRNRAASIDRQIVFAAGNGHEYTSWITGRSSNYASGDVIEDPAGIIESMLRDRIGYGNSDIDMPSFIDAENTSVAMRVNLHHDFQKSVTELIRMIAEQATFCFTWGAIGKARLVDLTNKTPTTNHVIPFSHVRDGKITIGSTRIIRDTLVVKSRWRQEFDEFNETNADDPIVDGSADGMVYTAEWRFLQGSSVSTVGGLYVNSTDGIWSKAHVTIDFETVGFVWAHIEEGDWIEVDSTTWDPQLKLPGGESWSGEQFLVTDVAQSFNGTKISAIRLW